MLHVVVGALWPPDRHSPAGGDSLLVTSAGWGLRLLLTLSVAVAVVLGPGLYLRQRTRESFLFGPAFVWVPGTLVLAVTGAVAWLLADQVAPELTVAVVLVPVLAVLTYWATRVPVRSVFVPGEAAVVGLLVVVVLVGVGKSTWSQSPTDELYAGTPSRTLEAGDRSDSRVPFHVVQLVAHGDHPYDLRTGAHYFFPYHFSDRPPLAGVSAAPVVLSSGAEPPVFLRSPPWEPFDREGFAAYRITMELLAATVVLSTFGLLRAFCSRRLAWAGTLVVAMTPFVIHEVYFTWPKLLAASFGVAALAALLSRRPGIAGALLGLSYLAHPGGVFVALAVAAIWLGVTWPRRTRSAKSPDRAGSTAWLASVARSGALLALGLVAAVVLWRLANIAVDGDFDNDRFTRYLFEANTVRPVELSQWIESRLRSVGNTLVPFELFVWDHDAGPLNPPPDAPLNPLVIPFTFQYWNTVPFGVGIVYFPLFLAGLWRFGRRNPAVALAGILVPFLIFATYWGSSASGLLREGLQGWLVFALLAAFLGHSAYDGGWRRRWARVLRVVMPLRGVEVLVMLVASTAWTGGWFGDHRFVLTDLAGLGLMFGGVGVMMVLAWRAFDPAPLAAVREPAQLGSLRST